MKKLIKTTLAIAFVFLFTLLGCSREEQYNTNTISVNTGPIKEITFNILPINSISSGCSIKEFKLNDDYNPENKVISHSFAESSETRFIFCIEKINEPKKGIFFSSNKPLRETFFSDKLNQQWKLSVFEDNEDYIMVGFLKRDEYIISFLYFGDNIRKMHKKAKSFINNISYLEED